MTRRGSRALGIALAASIGASIGLACASEPPAPEPSACPAVGPRSAASVAFPLEGDADRGARLFLDHCEGCHARTTAMRAPDAPPGAPRLDCGAWIASVDDAYLYHAINRGPGVDGHGDGPPLGERLVPMDVADLVAYLRSLESD